ncbi:MAG: hypothetical protein WD969_07095 [Paracoccaceae bacterium]
MTKHIIDNRTERLDAKVLKRFAQAGQKASDAPGDQAMALHRQKRGADQGRARNYARIERGRSA